MNCAAFRFAVVGVALRLHAAAARAAAAVDLKIGDAAPVFSVKDDSGQDWKSAEHVGKRSVVVYFYPADMTGGCAKQASGFCDDMAKLSGKDIQVSGDTVGNQEVFKKAYDLNFALLADTEGKVAKKFGVPVTPGEKTVKTPDGKELTCKVTTTRIRLRDELAHLQPV